MAPRAVNEFQDTIAELAARSGEATTKLLAGMSRLSAPEARAFITDAYPAMLDPFLSASASLTAQWYAEQPTVAKRPGSKVFTPEPALLVPGEQLAISGRWALTTPNPTVALQGNATRQVMNASRDTVIVNATNEGVRWVRQAKLNACGFCKMLATRAAKDLQKYSYSSEGIRRDAETGDYITVVIGKRGKTRGKRKLGSKFHDHCRCIAVMLRDNSYEPPEYVQQWTDQYDAIVAQEGTGDLYRISQLMDAGRVRTDRLPKIPDGADDLFAAAAAGDDIPVDLDAPEPAQSRTFEDVEAEFHAAIEAGDDAAVDRLAGELEDIEAAQRKAEQKAARAAARREADISAKSSRVLELIENEGYDPAEAEAEVFGISVERVRRRDFIAQARAEGHLGAGFDELLASVYRREIQNLYVQAEKATRGTIFNRATENKYGPGGLDALQLWTANESSARKWMSEEMARWFDENGRLTKSALRAMILDGRSTWRDAMTRDFNN